MSGSVNIDGKQFTFPDGWQVLKYDDCSFHRNQFQSFAGGSKALDAVALAPDHIVWLIEVKDYSGSRRSKAGTVFSEVAAKVRATLAGLAVARVRASDNGEREFAHEALGASSLRVALHLDQPGQSSRLFKQVIDPKTARTQLRRELRAVDPHAMCYGHGVAGNLSPWTVAPIPQVKGG